MSADLCFTTDFFFLLLFLVSYPRSSLNGTQPYPVTWPELSEIWKCMSEMWGIPSSYKSAAQKTTFFPRFRNLEANLTAYVFGTKHDIHKRASELQTARGLLHCLKTMWTLVHKRLQIGSEFSPTLSKFCIPFHYQASQMGISKRNSAKLCQTVSGKSR